jgi:hypothetical protein
MAHPFLLIPLPDQSHPPREIRPFRGVNRRALAVAAVSLAAFANPLYAANKQWDADTNGANGANGAGIWNLNGLLNWYPGVGTTM